MGESPMSGRLAPASLQDMVLGEARYAVAILQESSSSSVRVAEDGERCLCTQFRQYVVVAE